MSPTQLAPATRLWTRDEYHSMAEMGLFEGQRVQLVCGEVVVMSPQKHPHAFATSVLADALREIVDDGFWVREQLPLRLGESSEPEPDVAVVAGRPRDFTDHPSTAVLVVEVADTSLAFDRREKAALYAAVDIPEYWIVNLAERCIEVHRRPVEDAYSDTQIVDESGQVACTAFPDRTTAVAEILA